MLLIVLGSIAAASLVATLLAMARRSKACPVVLIRSALLTHRYNVLALKGVLDDLLQARRNRTELPEMPGKVAIVTGGSRGIGVEVVKMLLKCEMEVIIGCRRISAGEKTVKAIRDSGITSGKTKVMELDNANLDSVRRFAEGIKDDYVKIDLLVNNAGIMFTPYGETKDGFEQQYGVNYLSHFLLSLLLIPLLKNAGTPEQFSRIVSVSSIAHLVGDINFSDINHKESFLTGAAYAQSKLAQIMFTKTLARLFEKNQLPISAHAVHPGLVNTDLFHNTTVKYFMPILGFIFKNPTQGATSIVFAGVSPRIEKKSGLYISNCLDSTLNPLSNDEVLQDKLFELSLKQVQLENFTV